MKAVGRWSDERAEGGEKMNGQGSDEELLSLGAQR